MSSSWDIAVQNFRQAFNRAQANNDPNTWNIDLKSSLQSLLALRKQFNKKQRLLLLKQPSELDERKSDSDDQLIAAKSGGTKRRSQTNETGAKKKKDTNANANSDVNQRSLIDPSIRRYFDLLHQSFLQLEQLAINRRNRVPENTDLWRQLSGFISLLVICSFLVIKHIPPLLNIERKSLPRASVLAFCGYEAWKNPGGKVPPIFAGLITESQGREFKKYEAGQTPKFMYKLQYAATKSKARCRHEWVNFVPLKWIEPDVTGLNQNPSGLFQADFFEIKVSRGKKDAEPAETVASIKSKRSISPAEETDQKWMGGYHLYFYTEFRRQDGSAKHQALTMTFPFEVLTNYCGQKERKFRDAVWRLGFCINDMDCSAARMESETPRDDTLMKVLDYYFRGFINSDRGLNPVHKICLMRFLHEAATEAACPSGKITYILYKEYFWSYFFRAVDYIKENKVLWTNNLLNYCFLDRKYTEALLLQKKKNTMIFRFQESKEAHGIPSISLVIPATKTNPTYFAHTKLQEKIQLRHYTLLHCVQCAYLCKSYDRDEDRLKLKLTDFDVYGRGHWDPGTLEQEDQVNYYSRFEEDKPYFDYTDAKRMHFPIRVKTGDKEKLDRWCSKFPFSQLGMFLGQRGQRENYEWFPQELDQSRDFSSDDSSGVVQGVDAVQYLACAEVAGDAAVEYAAVPQLMQSANQAVQNGHMHGFMHNGVVPVGIMQNGYAQNMQFLPNQHQNQPLQQWPAIQQAQQQPLQLLEVYQGNPNQVHYAHPANAAYMQPIVPDQEGYQPQAAATGTVAFEPWPDNQYQDYQAVPGNGDQQNVAGSSHPYDVNDVFAFISSLEEEAASPVQNRQCSESSAAASSTMSPPVAANYFLNNSPAFFSPGRPGSHASSSPEAFSPQSDLLELGSLSPPNTNNVQAPAAGAEIASRLLTKKELIQFLLSQDSDTLIQLESNLNNCTISLSQSNCSGK